MNALSRREEDTLVKTAKAKALKECDPIVKDCATGRVFSVAWKCRDKYKAVQDCMVQYTGPEPMAAMRAEYLRLRDAQQAGGTILS
ncbi:hypothetical protein AcV7_000500 [Taiwanofungus camphoratus]|nr:hypothetical protein AcV7_000500 [Antrodia cinnamomea]